MSCDIVQRVAVVCWTNCALCRNSGYFFLCATVKCDFFTSVRFVCCWTLTYCDWCVIVYAMMLLGCFWECWLRWMQYSGVRRSWSVKASSQHCLEASSLRSSTSVHRRLRTTKTLRQAASTCKCCQLLHLCISILHISWHRHCMSRFWADDIAGILFRAGALSLYTVGMVSK